MNTDRWPQIEAALDELLDLPPDRRGERLAEIATRDAPLARELEPFLAGEAESAGPLDAPLETFAAAVFEDVPSRTPRCRPGASDDRSRGAATGGSQP